MTRVAPSSTIRGSVSVILHRLFVETLKSPRTPNRGHTLDGSSRPRTCPGNLNRSSSFSVTVTPTSPTKSLGSPASLPLTVHTCQGVVQRRLPRPQPDPLYAPQTDEGRTTDFVGFPALHRRLLECLPFWGPLVGRIPCRASRVPSSFLESHLRTPGQDPSR